MRLPRPWLNLCDFCHATEFLRNSLREGLIFCCLSQVGYKWGDVLLKSPVVKRSIVVSGHKTSVSLENEFWGALKVIAGKRLMTVSDLVGSINAQRQRGNLSSALRLFVLEFYRSQIPNIEDHDKLHGMLARPTPLPSLIGEGTAA